MPRALPKNKRVFAMVAIEPRQRHIAAVNFAFMRAGSMIVEQEVTAHFRLFLNGERYRKVAAVKQQLAVRIVGMTHRQIGKERRSLVHRTQPAP